VITGIVIVDEGWWQGYDSNGNFGMFPSTYVEKNSSSSFEAPPTSAPPTAAAGATGKTAVALYEYQASDDNELNFAEGEMIMEIEFVDDNWWQGKNASGYFGMFPANYVELSK